MYKFEDRYSLTTFYEANQKSDDEVCFSRGFENVNFNKYLPLVEHVCINRKTQELVGTTIHREELKLYEVNHLKPLDNST